MSPGSLPRNPAPMPLQRTIPRTTTEMPIMTRNFPSSGIISMLVSDSPLSNATSLTPGFRAAAVEVTKSCITRSKFRIKPRDLITCHAERKDDEEYWEVANTNAARSEEHTSELQ